MKSFALGAWLVSLGLAFAQQSADKLSFEVASIKATDPNPANRVFIGMSADGAMVKYTNITLRDCIRGAYRARDFQIVGPEWMTKARYEINAKLPSNASTDQIPEMLQALLAERFQLEIRREKRDYPIYALVAGSNGPKLKAGEVKSGNQPVMALGSDGKPRPMMMFRGGPDGVALTAPSATLTSLAELMSRFTVRPVVDMTGIEGQYEFNLKFAPETNTNLISAGPSGPDGVARALEPAPSAAGAVKQYGLRLEARKAPIEMFIVTHLEKTPTEN